MRYFVYCRKSSEAEDRQILSIESQLSTLRRAFDGRDDIEIVAVFEEAFSAKAPGRPLFNQMIDRLEAREADGIIAWAPDRLARNSIDGGRVIYLLDRGVIRDLKFSTWTFENNSQGKFMLQIMFGQSKYYSDALSENVKRGNRTKLERGWRPNKAPIGYLNDPTTKTIIKDPDRAAIVRRIFDFMLTGCYSPRRICELAAYEWGLRTVKRNRSGGKPITLSAIYALLKNPFYAGSFVWDGVAYQGSHEPIVTLDEMDRVRALLGRPEKPRPHTRTFPFTGMIRCGECGLLVTAEEKTNRYGSRYTYYHCTKRRFDYQCRQPCIRAESLEAQIQEFIAGLTIPPKLHAWAIKHLERSRDAFKAEQKQRELSVRAALEDARKRISNLTSLRLRELIGEDEFTNERKSLEEERLRLEQALTAPAKETFEPGEALISFRNRATDWFRAGDYETKRLILETVGSNPTLIDKKLSIQAAKPFRVLSKNERIPVLLGVLEDIRILRRANDPQLLLALKNIRRLNEKFSGPGPHPKGPSVCYWRKPRRHHPQPSIEELREAMNRPPVI